MDFLRMKMVKDCQVNASTSFSMQEVEKEGNNI